ncbi:MAG TPA: hypothetical protein VGD69_17315 [Herpetosiphonaceae bacterium]
MITYAAIIVHHGKAYVPVNAHAEGGPYLLTTPVFTADLAVDSLVKALEQVIAVGHPPLGEPSEQAPKKGKNPLLAAMKVTSWKKLEQESASYGLYWRKDKIELYLHNPNKRGQYINDSKRFVMFPLKTPLQEIARVILEDLEKLPELGFPDVKNP